MVRSVAWATTTVCPLASGFSSRKQSHTQPKPSAQPVNLVKKSEVKVAKPHGQGSVPVRVPLPPDEAMAAAQSRAVKLRTVLATLGEDDETCPTSRSPRAGTSHLRADQEHSVVLGPEANTSRAVSSTMQAREALSKGLAVQEEQETLLAEGEEVGCSPGERESHVIPVHCPRTRGAGSGRVQPIARDHRRFAEGVGESSLWAASTINVVRGRRGHGCR